MSTDDQKNLVIQYIEKVWNRGDLVAFDDLTTPAFTYQLGEQLPRDRTAMRQFLASLRKAFPDWRIQVTHIIAEHDTVAVRWFGQVTHEGAFHGIPATGRRITVSGINFYRIADGKIVAEWEQTDSLSMLRQLGALPTS